MKGIPIPGVLLLGALPAIAGAQVGAGDVVVSQSAALRQVRFTIITSTGYIEFSVPGDWHVIAMQSKLPVAAAAFELPNAADKDTPDSTNLSISLIQPDTKPGKRALSHVGVSYEGKVTSDSRAGWECFSQSAHQKGTLYTIQDAKKSVAGLVVSVRLAWPHLSQNPPGYEADMQAVFGSLLGRVEGALGPYPVKSGDVVRHPER